MLSIFHVSVGDLYVFFREMSTEGNSLTFSSALWAMKQGLEIWWSVMVPRGCPGGANGKEPACQRDAVRPLSQEDHLEEDMATHSSIIVWITPLSEEPDSPQSVGLQRVGHNWVTNTQSPRKSESELVRVEWMWSGCHVDCVLFLLFIF